MSEVKFAKHIIKQYSTGLDGLSDGECQDLIYKGFEDTYLKNSQCRALRDVLGLGRDGMVTEAERKRLSGVGFSNKFIDALAGEDGKAALRRRVRWLSEFYLSFQDISDAKRKEAFKELASVGRDAKGAIPALMEAAKSDDESIRLMAAETLGKIGPDAAEAVPALTAILKNKKGKKSRIEAAKALAKIGVAKGALPALADVFNAKSQELRLAAIEAFGEICSQPSVSQSTRDASIYWLVLISQDNDEVVRETVKVAFKKLKVNDETIIKTLMEIVQDEKSDLRGFATRALGRWERTAEPAVPLLIDVFRNDKDDWMRLDAAQALARIATVEAFKALGETGSDEAISAFVLALQSPNSAVRQWSAHLLGNVGTENEITDLVPLLDDPQIEVRCAAVRSIGKLGTESSYALKLLLGSLDDSASEVKVDALRSIGKMGPVAKKAFKRIESLLKDSDDKVRAGAVETLLRLNPDRAIKALKGLDEYAYSAIPVLLRHQNDKSWAVRRAVLITFGNLGEKSISAVPRIEDVLIDTKREREDRDRALAAATLGRIGVNDASTIAALLVGKGDKSAKVSKASADVLRRHGIARLIPPLLEIMEDVGSDMAVRKAATNHLAKFGNKAASAVPRLIGMLGSKDEETRIMAAYVIASIGRKAKDAEAALIAARDSGSENLKKTVSIALDKIGYEEEKPEAAEPEATEPEVKAPEVEVPEIEIPEIEIPEITVPEVTKPEEAPAEVEAPAEEKAASVEDLVEAISSGDSADRRKAAAELSKKGKEIKKIQGSLTTLLTEGDDLARELSAIVLFSSNANSKNVLKAWVDALADSNKKVSSLATAALNKNAKKAAPILIAEIKGGDDAGKAAAIKCIAQMGKLAKPAVKAIAGHIESDNLSLRMAAADAIVKLGKNAAAVVPIIIAKMGSERRSTRSLATMILFKLGVKSKKAIDAFIARLEDEDKAVRAMAQMALTKMGGDAVPFLIKAYKKGDLNKKIVVLGTFGKFSEHTDEATNFLKKVIAEGEPVVRKIAAGILMRLGVITPEEAKEAFEAK